MGPSATARFGTGDLVTRAVANTADAGAAPGALAVAAASLAAPVGAVVALGLIDPWLAVAFLASVPALWSLLIRALRPRASSDGSARYQQAQGEIAARLIEALGGARTVAAAATTDRETARVLRPLPELDPAGIPRSGGCRAAPPPRPCCWSRCCRSRCSPSPDCVSRTVALTVGDLLAASPATPSSPPGSAC